MFNGDASIVEYTEGDVPSTDDANTWSGNRPRDDIINDIAYNNWWRTYSPLVAVAAALPLFTLWGFLLYKLYKG